MTRLGLIPDNSATSYLSDLEKEINELKSSRQLTGGASMIYKQSDTGATADWTGVLPYGGGANPYNAKFLVTATATKQSVLLADLIWKVKVNGVTKTLEDSSSLYVINTYPKTSNATTIQQWYVIVFWANNTDTFAVKAYVLGTDSAAITVAAL